MSAKPFSNWKCSPERLDPTKGYMKSNVVLTVHELNGRTQFCKEKVQQISQLVKSTSLFITEEDLDDLSLTNSNSRKVIARSNVEGVDYIGCSKCDKNITATEFLPSDTSKGCLQCRSLLRKAFRKTLLGKLRQIYDGKRVQYATS